MRKIKSAEEIARIRRRNNIILGLVMIGLLVASTAGYSLMSQDFGDSENSVVENGFEFFRSEGLWKVLIGDQVFGFFNLPSEVSDIDVNFSIELGDYNGKVLYFVNPSEGSGEILNNIGRYVLRYQEACLEGTDCPGDLPVKSCEDSNLIVFLEGDETRVYGEGACVFIKGDSLKGSDAFLYKVLGINY